MTQDILKVLFTQQQIAGAVQALGQRISRDYRGRKVLMVGVLKGAAVFFADLIRAVDLPVEIDFVAASSYGAGTVSSGQVRLTKALGRPVEGYDLLLVEDILDTGQTLSSLAAQLQAQGASSVRTAVLLDKPARRAVPFAADYRCFVIEDEFVVGYGLDYAEKYRNLPFIGVLHPEVYSR